MSEEIQILTRWVDPTIDDFKIALEEANKQIEEDNKEIERLHQCIKDDKENADEIISEQTKEIERLNKDNGDITKLFAKEREETKRLNNIIKEALILTEHTRFKEQYASDEILLPILNKLRESGIKNYIKVEGDKE